MNRYSLLEKELPCELGLYAPKHGYSALCLIATSATLILLLFPSGMLYLHERSPKELDFPRRLSVASQRGLRRLPAIERSLLETVTLAK